MKKNNVTFLREALEQIPTSQLDEMLHSELGKENLDENLIRLILSVLKDREREYTVVSSTQVDAAWKQYRDRIAAPLQKPARKRSWLLRAATIAAMICILLFVIPQEVGAESLFERLMRWTDSIFELFDPGQKNNRDEYVFETDNPGLQQVYDAVVELGITDPVVPMWLPEGYELKECKTIDTWEKKRLVATFAGFESEIVFYANIYNSNTAIEYPKDAVQVVSLEIDGVIHNIMYNKDIWTAVWTRDNIECSIFIGCQEEALYVILESIYSVGDE